MNDTVFGLVSLLANVDPFEFDELDRVSRCFFCSAEDRSPGANMADPHDPIAIHEPECLWRRAKEFVANEVMARMLDRSEW
jgi:hypothetical protein